MSKAFKTNHLALKARFEHILGKFRHTLLTLDHKAVFQTSKRIITGLKRLNNSPGTIRGSLKYPTTLFARITYNRIEGWWQSHHRLSGENYSVIIVFDI